MTVGSSRDPRHGTDRRSPVRRNPVDLRRREYRNPDRADQQEHDSEPGAALITLPELAIELS